MYAHSRRCVPTSSTSHLRCTDNASLLEQRHISHHLARWLNLLAEYQYTGVHIIGRNNPSDLLTRQRFRDGQALPSGSVMTTLALPSTSSPQLLQPPPLPPLPTQAVTLKPSASCMANLEQPSRCLFSDFGLLVVAAQALATTLLDALAMGAAFPPTTPHVQLLHLALSLWPSKRSHVCACSWPPANFGCRFCWGSTRLRSAATFKLATTRTSQWPTLRFGGQASHGGFRSNLPEGRACK